MRAKMHKVLTLEMAQGQRIPRAMRFVLSVFKLLNHYILQVKVLIQSSEKRRPAALSLPPAESAS